MDGFVGNPLDFPGVAAAENLICFLDSKRGLVHLWNPRVSERLFQSKAILTSHENLRKGRCLLISFCRAMSKNRSKFSDVNTTMKNQRDIKRASSG